MSPVQVSTEQCCGGRDGNSPIRPGAWATGVLGRGSQALLTVLKLNNVLELVGSKNIKIKKPFLVYFGDRMFSHAFSQGCKKPVLDATMVDFHLSALIY